MRVKRVGLAMKINFNIANNLIDKPLKKFANSKFMEKICKNYRENNSEFITALGVGSIIAKDAYGCYEYVRQNNNNEAIPVDKRKFLSALDLANGTLMIAAQLTAYLTISKKTCQTKLFNKFTKNSFAEKTTEKLFQKIKKTFPNLTNQKFNKNIVQYKENTLLAFTHVVTLLGTTILVKRIIVPFMAMPIADKLKEKFLQKKD